MLTQSSGSGVKCLRLYLHCLGTLACWPHGRSLVFCERREFAHSSEVREGTICEERVTLKGLE